MNRILYAADCLDVLNDEDELPSESIDLIYLDPPFNSNSNYNLPFKGRDKSLKPVEAFKDTWEWTADDGGRLEEMESDPRTRSLAAIVRFAQEVEGYGRRAKPSLAAYLINMSLRLLAMRRVLKPTGSIYLHCDPTASHYLKLAMDAVFGKKNFRNEIVWKRYASKGKGSQHLPKSWGSMTDTILYYAYPKSALSPFRELTEAEVLEKFPKLDEQGRRYNTGTPLFRSRGMGPRPNLCYEWRGFVNPHSSGWRLSKERLEEEYQKGNVIILPDEKLERRKYEDDYAGEPVGSLWAENILTLSSNSNERLGYPTQKPLALLERIIKASSNPDDIILDPFCGCGTTVHAAETLGRRWIGIDISPFSTGLIRERMIDNFHPALTKSDIVIRGIPHTIEDARALARRDKFEFEKWVCGFIGAEGMFRQPGERGADGGVDGLLKFYRFVPKKVAKAEYAVVQVKGGKVTPDSVRALRETVDRLGATAGVMVCFEQYMRTVDNQRSRDTFADVFGSYPVIQGYSIENLLANAPLDLPTYGRRRKSGLLNL